MMSHRHVVIACMLCFAILLGVPVLVVAWRVATWLEAVRVEAKTRELAAEEIRPTFMRLTGHDLPEKTEHLRALYAGARGSEIFVRFSTDTDGIEYVLDTFRSGRSTDMVLSSEQWRASTRHGHGTLFLWAILSQRSLGVKIYDPNSVASARVLKTGPIKRTCYEILIDEEQKTVYIYVYHRL